MHVCLHRGQPHLIPETWFKYQNVNNVDLKSKNDHDHS